MVVLVDPTIVIGIGVGVAVAVVVAVTVAVGVAVLVWVLVVVAVAVGVAVPVWVAVAVAVGDATTAIPTIDEWLRLGLPEVPDTVIGYDPGAVPDGIWTDRLVLGIA
jgi:hypothetical protein